jgi:hypothetical protein
MFMATAPPRLDPTTTWGWCWSNLTYANNGVANALFHALCPTCNGKKEGCKDCRQVGWVPKWRHYELDFHAE